VKARSTYTTPRGAARGRALFAVGSSPSTFPASIHRRDSGLMFVIAKPTIATPVGAVVFEIVMAHLPRRAALGGATSQEASHGVSTTLPLTWLTSPSTGTPHSSAFSWIRAWAPALVE